MNTAAQYCQTAFFIDFNLHLPCSFHEFLICVLLWLAWMFSTPTGYRPHLESTNKCDQIQQSKMHFLFSPHYRPIAPGEATKHQRWESDFEHWRQGECAASLGPPQRGRPAAPPLQSDLERPEWKGKQQGRRRGKASPVQLISHIPQKPNAALTLAPNTEHIFLSHLHCSPAGGFLHCIYLLWVEKAFWRKTRVSSCAKAQWGPVRFFSLPQLLGFKNYLFVTLS